MAESLEERDSAVVSSAGDPGPLSRLLQELADASGEDALDAWKKELHPGDRVGRFEIRREVGRGGFGAVYEAFDTELNRVVAVKTLRLSRPRRDLSSDWIRKEAEAVARLDHPCIVTLHDVGTCDSGPYLVMELLRGKTLAQRIAEGPVPLDEALRIAEEMAKGLAPAHQRGVLHRDLKPANVFHCEDGRVKLLDFGLAHLLGTEGLSGAGTPKYMAPEQARGEAVDQRADVYAAGRVLGEMFGETRPRRLERAIAPATSTDPGARPRDGQAWLDFLQAARNAEERPARVRRIALLAGLGVVLGGVIAGALVHRASRPHAASSTAPSIAVLPFTDMSPTRDQEYLSDGLAEEILNALTRVEGLKVIGRSSSFYFKGKDIEPSEVARRLAVNSLLEGSIRRDGDRIRISAQLVNAADGVRIWSHSYDREMGAVFVLQEEVALEVARALRSRLLPSAKPDSVVPEAYRQYLLATQIMRTETTLDDTKRALRSLEQAVALDPGFARAWARLATIGVGVGSNDPDPRTRRIALQKARADAARAIDLAPDAGDGYSAQGQLRMTLDYDWAGARVALDKALRLNPSDGLTIARIGLLHSALGQLPDAIRAYRRAVELEPLSADLIANMGGLQLNLGDLGGAQDSARRALEIAPKYARAVMLLGKTLLLQGHVDEVIELASVDEDEETRMHLMALASRSHDPALDGAADRYMERFGEKRPLRAAEVAAYSERPDDAFRLLERGIANLRIGGNSVGAIRNSPFFRPLHSDPRWAELLRKMNLPVD